MESTQPIDTHTEHPRPVFWGLITFIIVGFFCALLIYLEYQLRYQESEQRLHNAAESVRTRIEQTLQYSFSATQTIALTINNKGLPINFDSVARYILSYNQYIDAIHLSPGGIVKYIYPYEANRSVYNFDALKDSAQRAEALKAIDEQRLIFAGPVQLVQGGLGFVGRLPITINGNFWGFSSVLVRMSSLLEAAGIDTSGSSGFYYQLSKIDRSTGKELFFLPDKIANPSERYNIRVHVPNDTWTLYIDYARPQAFLKTTFLLSLLALVLAIMAGIMAYNRSQTPARLQNLVEERTQELETVGRRSRAILNALPDMVVMLDKDNNYIEFSDPFDHPHLKSTTQAIGKNMRDLVPKELMDDALRFKKEALQSQKVVSLSYTLNDKGQNRFFEARFTPLNSNEVLILIREVTNKELAEQRIRESEIKYRTLVEQANDAIIIADLHGAIKVVNPAASKMSFYSSDELLKMNSSQLAHPGELELRPFRMEEVALGSVVNSERKLLRKDGSLIDVEITAKLIAPDRFLSFIRDISERKRVEEALRQSHEDLRSLSNHIEAVREQERLHISREIHDELGQHLTVLKMDVSRLAKKAQLTDPSMTSEFQAILQAINNMVLVVRRISTELRPGMLDDLGLIAAIDWYAQDFQKRTGIETSFLSSVNENELPRNLVVGMFRIFQESLTNVARHADATKVEISLVRQENYVVLLIEDNGRGFDEATMQEKKTLGILGMKERAIMMGGNYHIHSKPGDGTVVEVVIPLPHSPQEV